MNINDDGIVKYPAPEEEKIIIPKGHQSQVKPLMFALASSFLFAFGDYLIADLSPVINHRWMYAQWFNNIIVGLIYHIFQWRHNNSERAKNELAPLSFFDKSGSVYWKSKGESFVVDMTSVWVAVRRGLFQSLINFLLDLLFFNANAAKMNTGIVTVLFSISLVLTSVWFFFRHGERLGVQDYLGVVCIGACVAMVSSGGSHSSDGNVPITDPLVIAELDEYKDMAVMIGLILGVIFTFNGIECHYNMQNTRVNSMQANIDGHLLIAIVMLPIWIWQMSSDPDTYTWFTFIESNGVVFCFVIGLIFLTEAFKTGKGGTV